MNYVVEPFGLRISLSLSCWGHSAKDCWTSCWFEI